ncbi:Phosphoenolpyruvate synthase [Serinicoccus hydrothermalis]|uniref:Phosphoenolpyruvate synthase n=1 Tax=Serinicoccus hydrothermalis TaxID=1758689 RepID=A0A1B1NFK0_9MICO|nr:PEP/pyruvate-binding domain-containing protein [Serinicoccus hydrothermalis]ANS80145.1 Phosphoenolpyruvate synthase [Serinicoccus hydrothermalis]
MRREPGQQRAVLRLEEVGAEDLALVGGKGANLGELIDAGLPVPRGFVVTTQGYAEVAAGVDVSGDLGDGSAVRHELAGVDIPDGLREQIVAAYADLGEPRVAVRSSATAEDLPGAAFAGQQDTYLDVTGTEQLLRAVRECWASLWTERAIAYRRRLGISPSSVALAVVVQEMVPADAAGVMFTANPVTGSRDEVVVNAAPGLGEALVSGEVTPETSVVAGGRVTERTAGESAGPVVPDETLLALAALGRRVAEHFGRPQDIEWAVTGSGLSLLQARPMTALPPPPLDLAPVQRLTGPQILEMLPARPYPLDVSAWIAPGLGRMVQRMLLEIPGLTVSFADVLPERDGVVERFVPPHPRPTARVLTAPARILPRLRCFRPARWWDDPRWAAFDARVRRMNATDLAGLDWAGLLATHQDALAALDLVTDLRVDHLPRAAVDLVGLRLAALALGRWSPALTRGIRSRTEATNDALQELADLAREDDDLVAALDAQEPMTALDDPRFAGFREQLDAVLRDFGHRESASPLFLSLPTWRDAPETVLALVRMLVDRPAGSEAAEGGAAAHEAVAAQRHLLEHPLLRGPLGEPVRGLLDDARAGIAFREDSHFEATRVLPVLRAVMLEVGRRLAGAGVLAQRDDVWHLRWEEVAALGDLGDAAADAAAELRHTVDRRRARREELASVPLIAPGAFRRSRGAPPDALVTGTPASAGRASGPVRVIRKPADFARLRPGDVLVCSYTNPSWTPLFQRAVAVVVDTGGVGSHAAIVAREYAVPAVMGTGTGTRALRDGQLVVVDGDAGVVTAAPAVGP